MFKRLSFLLVAVMAAVSIGRAADEATVSEKFKIAGSEVTLARYAKSFIGPGNVKVDIAPYTAEAGIKGAILWFHGIESEWDGKAIVHRVKPADYEGIQYIAKRNGKDWHTLISRKDEEGVEGWDLYVPGSRDSVKLVPSDGAAQLTNPRAIFQEYEAQQKQSAK